MRNQQSFKYSHIAAHPNPTNDPQPRKTTVKSCILGYAGGFLPGERPGHSVPKSLCSQVTLMRIPQVAIVGRPNVGKSSIFNWLAGKRLAIVDDLAGVTRDRMTFLMESDDHYFEIVDTGGIGITDTDNLTEDVEYQISIGIQQADLILFVVDTRAGILPLDELVAERLRHVDKPIVLVANKTDGPTHDTAADDFYRLGHGQPLRTSTTANRNLDELMESIHDRLPSQSSECDGIEEPEMRIAIVGRRNVGKSTFVNTLVASNRMIVSEIPGTTRDSVDVRFELDGKSFVAIDTPGLRRRVSIRSNVDYYGTHRAERSIRRSDVTLVFFDCSQRIGKVDKQLCSYVADQNKPCIFVVNKWDLMVGQMPTDNWATYLRETFGNLGHVPIAFITGQTGKNAKTLLNHAQMLFKQARQRVGTSQLNTLLKHALRQTPPPLYKNRRPKVYYATQIAIQPPTIIMVCNDPNAFSKSYRRYLLNALRDELPFGEIPIRIFMQKRKPNDSRDDLLANERPAPRSR